MNERKTVSSKKLFPKCFEEFIETYEKLWEETVPAPKRAYFSPHTYECDVESVSLRLSHDESLGLRITFKVTAGAEAGRKLFRDMWLTLNGMPRTKCDCRKLGLDTLEKVKQAIQSPGHIRCLACVEIDSLNSYGKLGRVHSFEVLNFDECSVDQSES